MHFCIFSRKSLLGSESAGINSGPSVLLLVDFYTQLVFSGPLSLSWNSGLGKMISRALQDFKAFYQDLIPSRMVGNCFSWNCSSLLHKKHKLGFPNAHMQTPTSTHSLMYADADVCFHTDISSPVYVNPLTRSPMYMHALTGTSLSCTSLNPQCLEQRTDKSSDHASGVNEIMNFPSSLLKHRYSHTPHPHVQAITCTLQGPGHMLTCIGQAQHTHSHHTHTL